MRRVGPEVHDPAWTRLQVRLRVVEARYLGLSLHLFSCFGQQSLCVLRTHFSQALDQLLAYQRKVKEHLKRSDFCRRQLHLLEESLVCDVLRDLYILNVIKDSIRFGSSCERVLDFDPGVARILLAE